MKEMSNKGCRYCGISVPDNDFNSETQKPSWFGKYENDILVEFVCGMCYFEKGKKEEWDKMALKNVK